MVLEKLCFGFQVEDKSDSDEDSEKKQGVLVRKDRFWQGIGRCWSPLRIPVADSVVVDDDMSGCVARHPAPR